MLSTYYVQQNNGMCFSFTQITNATSVYYQTYYTIMIHSSVGSSQWVTAFDELQIVCLKNGAECVYSLGTLLTNYTCRESMVHLTIQNWYKKSSDVCRKPTCRWQKFESLLARIKIMIHSSTNRYVTTYHYKINLSW